MIIQVLVLFLLVFGSVPLAFYCARKIDQGAPFEKIVGKLTAFLVSWCFIETSLAILLAFAGLFTTPYAATAHFTLMVVGLIALRVSGAKLASAYVQNSTPNISKVSGIIIFLFTFPSLLLFWNGLIWPTVEMDSLSYHLPLLAKLVQTGKITFLNHFWFQEHYPRNWETLCSLYVLPFKNDMFMLFPNLVARCIFAFSIVALAAKAGVTANRAMASSFLILTAPIINTHMETMNVDVPFAGFFLAALYFSIVFSETGSWVYGFLLAMSISMFLGIKSTGFLYGFLLLLAMIWVHLGNIPNWYWPNVLRSAIARTFRAVFQSTHGRRWTVFALILIPGTFWYVFNLVNFGNPMVGVQTDIAGHIIFPGYYPVEQLSRLSLQHVFHPLRSGDFAYLFHEILRELEYGFLIIAILTGGFIIGSFIRFKQFWKSRYFPLYLALSLATLMIYYRTPFSGHFNPNMKEMTSFVGQAFRLGFPCIGLMGVLGAGGLEKLKIPDWILALAVGAIYVQANVHNEKILLIAFCAVGFLLFLKNGFFMRLTALLLNRKAMVLGIAGVVFPLAILMAYGPMNALRTKNSLKRSYGPAVEFLDRHLISGEVVAFPVSDASYIFCGSNFSHNVLYIPCTHSDFQGWISELRNQNVSIIGVGPASVKSAYDEALALMLNSPDNFELLFGNAPGHEVTLFKFKAGI